MNPLGTFVVLGLLVGVWAQTTVDLPPCDDPEVEHIALVARDYLNAQHTHGYKYDLNRIEKIKFLTAPNGEQTFVLEIDLLETDCHVLDPTPVANCTVRPKILTAVEGDCDVVLKEVNGAFTVIAFKCKTEESTEDLCVGCHTLLPLNETTALDFVHASLATFNNNKLHETYTILEVGRMSSQVVSGGPQYSAEYVIIEANCTNGNCLPLSDPMAKQGICTAKGSQADHNVDCKMFSNLMPVVDANTTTFLPRVIHVHGGSLPHKHGLKHHKLTALHNPDQSSHLSAESDESAEIVPEVPAVVDAAPVDASPVVDAAPVNAAPVVDAAPVVVAAPVADADAAAALDSSSASDSSSKEMPLWRFKRDVAAIMAEPAPAAQAGPISPLQLCPGRIRFF